MALSTKQRAFVSHYLKGWNATKAAIQAGYSEKSARQIGSRLLTNVDVSKAIRARLDALQMSADEVLVRQTKIARASLADFVEYDDRGEMVLAEDGGPKLNFGSRRARRSLDLVKGFERTTRKFMVNMGGEEPTEVVESTFKFALHDAAAAQVQMGKHRRLWVDRLDVTEVDWRKEALEAGLNPDDVLKEYADTYARLVAAGTAGADAGSDSAGEGGARGRAKRGG